MFCSAQSQLSRPRRSGHLILDLSDGRDLQLTKHTSSGRHETGKKSHWPFRVGWRPVNNGTPTHAQWHNTKNRNIADRIRNMQRAWRNIVEDHVCIRSVFEVMHSFTMHCYVLLGHVMPRKLREASGSFRKLREASGSSGKLREASGSSGKLREASGSFGNRAFNGFGCREPQNTNSTKNHRLRQIIGFGCVSCF